MGLKFYPMLNEKQQYDMFSLAIFQSQGESMQMIQRVLSPNPLFSTFPRDIVISITRK